MGKKRSKDFHVLDAEMKKSRKESPGCAFVVALTRFELAISALRGRRPKPLDDRAIWCLAAFRTTPELKPGAETPGRSLMVALTRFELAISALRGRRPKPLDDRAIGGWGGRSRTPTYGTRIRCPTIRRHPSVPCVHAACVARVSILRIARTPVKDSFQSF